MKAEVIRVDRSAGSAEVTARAAAALAAGQVVVFPTETVYGVGAAASSAESVRRLRDAKGRTSTQPFTVHIGRRGDIDRFVPDVSPVGRRLVDKGWPGPLTLLFRLAEPSRAPVYAELPPEGHNAVFHGGVVGLRCPDDAIAMELLTAAGVPIIASSANRAGRPAPVTAEEALAELDGLVDLLIDGGRARYGRPSTIVTLNGKGYSITREGVYDERTIRRLATYTILFVCSGNTCRSPIAEALTRKMLAERLGVPPAQLTDLGITIASAGAFASAGVSASPEAVEVCRSMGADLSGHRSRPLTPELIESADRIYAMATQHVDAIIGMVPTAGEKLQKLDESADIADPVGGTHEQYASCAERIAGALARRLTEVPL